MAEKWPGPLRRKRDAGRTNSPSVEPTAASPTGDRIMSATMTRDETTTNLDELTRDGLFYEYSQAADPIGSGVTPPVPFAEFRAALHERGPTRVVPLDLSLQLGRPGPATSPSLCANFVRVRPDESIAVRPNASSQI